MKMSDAKTDIQKIAVIRIRGSIGRTKKVEDTLCMLKLYKKNSCAILSQTPSILGMIKKVKDCVTWGEISEDVLKLLNDKRGNSIKEGDKETNPIFKLNSPKGGFERRGIKVSFRAGGVLGYRGEKINNLIKKMV